MEARRRRSFTKRTLRLASHVPAGDKQKMGEIDWIRLAVDLGRALFFPVPRRGDIFGQEQECFVEHPGVCRPVPTDASPVGTIDPKKNYIKSLDTSICCISVLPTWGKFSQHIVVRG